MNSTDVSVSLANLGEVMRVYVTQEDIVDGEAGHCRACPVARALTRAFPASFIDVDCESAFIGAQLVALPDAACDFINAFDHIEERGYVSPLLPFHFDIPTPEVNLR